jgi:hypothetical protein
MKKTELALGGSRSGRRWAEVKGEGVGVEKRCRALAAVKGGSEVVEKGEEWVAG